MTSGLSLYEAQHQQPCDHCLMTFLSFLSEELISNSSLLYWLGLTGFLWCCFLFHPLSLFAPRVPFCESDIPWPWHLQSFSFLFSATTLLWNLSLHVTLMSLPVCFFLSTEWYLVWALLLRCIQGNEPHAVHRLWPSGPRESIRYLAHHAEHDCRSYLLCCFYWSRDGSYPVPGLF